MNYLITYLIGYVIGVGIYIGIILREHNDMDFGQALLDGLVFGLASWVTVLGLIIYQFPKGE